MFIMEYYITITNYLIKNIYTNMYVIFISDNIIHLKYKHIYLAISLSIKHIYI